MRCSLFLASLTGTGFAASARLHIPNFETDTKSSKSWHIDAPAMPTTFPTIPRPQDPFANKSIPKVPDACTNFLKVSEECEEALNGYSAADAIVFGGSLVFEDGSCTAKEKAGLQTAVYDALYLSSIAHVPTNAREFAPWRDYVGPDYVDYQQRMLG